MYQIKNIIENITGNITEDPNYFFLNFFSIINIYSLLLFFLFSDITLSWGNCFCFSLFTSPSISQPLLSLHSYGSLPTPPILFSIQVQHVKFVTSIPPVSIFVFFFFFNKKYPILWWINKIITTFCTKI